MQEAALVFMAVVYTLRVRWLLLFKAGRERQAATGSPSTTRTKGIIYSWANIAMPWSMESTRTKAFLYLQFVLFHLGVAVAILLSFLIPYAPEALKSNAVLGSLRFLIGAAFIVSLIRLSRRISQKNMRAISSPDDYFSLVMLAVWLFFALMSVPNQPEQGEGVYLTYFFMTAFFLIYVPFSKISHYLYYPFTRYYFGKTMGHRGVYPIKSGPAAELIKR